MTITYGRESEPLLTVELSPARSIWCYKCIIQDEQMPLVADNVREELSSIDWNSLAEDYEM